MTGEVFVRIGPLHPHLVLEALAYAVGFQVYRWQRRRRGDVVDDGTRWTVIAAAAVGAALGSKLLGLANHPGELAEAVASPLAFLAGGKTIVGGLLGGWIGVELAKRAIGEERRTGDLFALPLAVGMAIGRVGCFLTGLPDRTSGLPTTSPLGFDFGDGVLRHPTQLYEIAFLVAAAAVLGFAGRARVEGQRFRTFVFAYLAFRFAIDFLKPRDPLGPLDAIQWNIRVLEPNNGFDDERKLIKNCIFSKKC